MVKSKLYKNVLLPVIGIGGYIIGSYIEKHKNSLQKYKPFPCLPIFGTVSAAAPISKFTDISPNVERSPRNSVQNRTSQIMKYGFPSLDNVRSYSDFIISYDQRNRVPNWAFEHLTKETVERNTSIDRSKCNFKEDPSIHPYFRSENRDYKSSGYDRGHLAAAGNHRICQQHVDETFYLTNIAPQVGPGFNRDIWNDLEQYVRKLARLHKNVYVCTGPLYLPKKEGDGKTYVKYEVIGANHVAVPTHFFKIVVMETIDNTFEMESYVMPNKPIEANTPLNVFLVPPESIERASGLLFFSVLAREKIKKINGRKTTYV